MSASRFITKDIGEIHTNLIYLSNPNKLVFIDSDYTVTRGDDGKIIVINSPDPFDITLPLSSEVYPGFSVTFLYGPTSGVTAIGTGFIKVQMNSGEPSNGYILSGNIAPNYSDNSTRGIWFTNSAHSGDQFTIIMNGNGGGWFIGQIANGVTMVFDD